MAAPTPAAGTIRAEDALSPDTFRRNRLPIVALLTANAISLFGDALTTIAIPWYVYATTGSAAKMGIVGFFTFLPRVLATFFGGGVVDRIGFKPSSMLADTLSGLSVLAIPLVHHTVGLSFPLLLLFVFLGAFFDGPGSTARESLVPELSRMAEIPLERINALYQMVQRLSQLLGPAAAGVLIGVMGASNVLAIDAATFGVSLVLIGLLVPNLHMRHDEQELSDGQRSWLQEMLDGLRLIRADIVLLWLAISIAITNFLEAPLSTVSMPVLIREHYGSAERLGLVFTTFGAGAVISTIAFASIGHRLPRHRTFAIAFTLASLPYFVFAMAPSFPVLLVASFAMGLAGGPINPILMTVRQERVPERIRARVFGTFTALAWCAIPLGQLVGGFSVQTFGVETTFAAIAVCFLATAVTMGINPALRGMNASPVRSAVTAEPRS
ncbi:MAG: MFS transporter [Thermomicrobiales bacterium]